MTTRATMQNRILQISIACLATWALIFFLRADERPAATQSVAEASPESTQPAAEYQPIFPAPKGKRWGYISLKGDWVIPPQFQGASSFGDDGFAVVRLPTSDEMTFGDPAVINRRGEILLPGGYQALGRGRFAVHVDGKHGFVGLIEPFHVSIECSEVRGPFNEGVLPYLHEDKWGFMDEEGRVSIAPQFEDVMEFTEGKAAARIGMKWGYIDHSGHWSIEPQFDSAASFSEGVANVTLGGRDKVIDHSGREAIKGNFRSVGSFREGLAIASNEERLYGFIDHSGQYVIPPRFRLVGTFNEGLAAAETRDGAAGYIDRTGQFVINLPTEWYWQNTFRNGMVLVWLKDQCGYVDRTGRWIYRASQ